MENNKTKRWRAGEREIYFTIHNRLGVCTNVEDSGTMESFIDYLYGNYFKNSTEACKAFNEINKTFSRINDELRDFE